MLRDVLAGVIDLLLNKDVITKYCEILLEKFHRVENFPSDPNFQQGNPCSFGVRELSTDEQEKRAAGERLPGQL